MTWEGTREIEETDQTKDDAPETRPPMTPESPTPSVSAHLHEQIAARARKIYERRTCQGPLDDWLQAEREILGQRSTRNADLPDRGGSASEEQD
ncbi:MAG TPA: DUF2934 domain-containing protein [Nitrospiraceae bacterium]|nr:DUF2934 domain-containing protein [Nitrospiraceae bacterium]